MGLIRGNTGDWEIVIGLEVHAQVSSNAKLFSGAATAYGAEPNTQVSLVDAAMPGMLPVINEWCVAQAVRTGLALNAQINKHSVFDRKNYFFPDLPQGYQISQFKQPVVGEGEVVVDLDDGESVIVRIERLHLEQDAGKSMHDQRPGETLIDLNRSGVALMEIVSKPDMRAPEQAGAYMRKLRTILRYIGSCDGNMDEGSLRCDVNVSVRRPGGELGTRCEIKNLNSVRHIMKAIEYEAHRQVGVLEDGGTIVQQTRLYDVAKGETRAMRSKEDAHDYRYFPDPDLLPLIFDDAFIETQRAALPELPDAKKARFQQQYGLSAYDAGVLVGEQASAAFFETAAAGRDAKLVANWTITELFGALNRLSKGIEDSPVTADNLGGLVDLIQDGTISGRLAKEVFAEMLETGETAVAVVDRKGLKQVSDEGAIAAAIDQVIAANPDKLAEYKGGKTKLAGFFVGQVMKATGGKANPQVVNKLLTEKLDA
ncbi:aspartyl/glutamyl-tRNA(Asn/Gln) amidotransferase subunit B [Tistrella bauzanensis]|uniref:Aspartyl/glutamyl-tRNA(Asn/Gln) amidotransferase subunit B n=1 Tax=Tistrella bauzanensis TaxID=657419 RepID=A0ABQ1J6R0_9PROT|nr:Asp-tRNA(Asn)/Glu-tRNA(Gln) amidotransferase subunit GatB [Tistrella bauzanensis]GGB61159.1 aspartyl/glutamyl-tRNA(Asn/Gln) amidotransferase subunit B [Tistrella bauzanensis]